MQTRRQTLQQSMAVASLPAAAGFARRAAFAFNKSAFDARKEVKVTLGGCGG